MDKTQKEYYLNEQMKAIQKELGESNDSKDEISEIEDKIKKINLSDEAREKVKSEIKKLKNYGSYVSRGHGSSKLLRLDNFIALEY